MEKRIFKLPSAEEIIEMSDLRQFRASQIGKDMEILKSHGILKTPDDEKLFVVLKLCSFQPGLGYNPKSIRDAKILYQDDSTNKSAMVIIPEAFKEFGQSVDALALRIAKALVEDNELEEALKDDFELRLDFHPADSFTIKEVVNNYENCLKKAHIFDSIRFQREVLPRWVNQIRYNEIGEISKKIYSNEHNLRDLAKEIEVAKIKAGVYEHELVDIGKNSNFAKAVEVFEAELSKQNGLIAYNKNLMKTTAEENEKLNKEKQFFSVTPHDYLLQQMGYDLEDEAEKE